MSVCCTDGSLVDAIMGGAKFRENNAMARGKTVEENARPRIRIQTK